MTWSLAALAVLGSALLVVSRRQRWRKSANDNSRSASAARSRQDPSLGAPSNAEARPVIPVRSCPVCLAEYSPEKRYCVRDGAPLSDGCASGAFSQGMICPTCRRGYASDASFCPEDADELVPYGLYGAASSTRQPIRLDAHKICPECGVRHAAAHLFCGQDGAELVIVN